MKNADTTGRSSLNYLKLFLALSRTTHSFIDLATPALAAILWLGALPPPWIVALGLVTAFAAYTAIYALNDMVDWPCDRQRIRHVAQKDASEYLDTVFLRHPVAQGALSVRMGFAWVIFWSIVAVTGAFLLNPVCALFFLAGAILEAVYCRMLLITHLRVLVSGVVKTLGGLAAVFAVDPNPSPHFLTLLFLWLFFWEIGGQNVPADLYDLEEDAELKFRTVPVRFGIGGAGRIMLLSLYLTLILNPLLLSATPRPFSPFVATGCLIAGIGLLLVPAHRFYRVRSNASVSRLFTRASLYPAAVLAVLLIHMLFMNLWG